MRPSGQGTEIAPKVFKIAEDSTVFQEYYDELQDLMKSIAGMDEFLKGQYTCIVAIILP